MQSELRVVGVYLYGGEFPALLESDKKTLNLDTTRTPQERDIDCGHCQPNTPSP